MRSRDLSSRKLDLSSLRAALEDRRVWTALGLVQVPAGSTSHYEITDDDVLVEVELLPAGEPLTCRLACTAAAGPGGGVWCIPAPGTEVVVLVPHGEFENDPVIIGTLSSNTVPYGLSATTLVIVAPEGGEVLIHDGSGSTEALVKKTEFTSHTHTIDNISAGAATKTTNSPAAITGTTVLKAK